MEKILIFDTTLRDGEQSPGFSMNIQEKLQVAKQLEKLNIDITTDVNVVIGLEEDKE